MASIILMHFNVNLVGIATTRTPFERGRGQEPFGCLVTHEQRMRILDPNNRSNRESLLLVVVKVLTRQSAAITDNQDCALLFQFKSYGVTVHEADFTVIDDGKLKIRPEVLPQLDTFSSFAQLYLEFVGHVYGHFQIFRIPIVGAYQFDKCI